MLAPEYLATQSNSQPLPQDHSRAKCHLPFQVFPFPKGMKPPLPWLISNIPSWIAGLHHQASLVLKPKQFLDPELHRVPMYQWIGGKILTGNPHDLNGKNHGFVYFFPLNQSIECRNNMSHEAMSFSQSSRISAVSFPPVKSNKSPFVKPNHWHIFRQFIFCLIQIRIYIYTHLQW